MKKNNALSVLNFGLCAIFLVFASDGIGQWSKNSDENNAIAMVPGKQSVPVIAKDFNQGAIIVWEDTRGGQSDIYGARIDVIADFLWQGPLADAMDDDEKTPAITASNDAFYIAWRHLNIDDNISDIRVQKYNTVGPGPLWGPIRAHTGFNFAPVIFQYNNRILTASYIYFGEDVRIRMQSIIPDDGRLQFNLNSQLTVNGNAKGEIYGQKPAVVPGLGDGLIAAWTDARDDTITYIKGIRQSGDEWSNGEFAIDDPVAENTYPVVVSDGNNGVIVFWTKSIFGGDNQFISAARYNANGEPVWEEPFPEVIHTSPGKKRRLRAVSDNQNGAFVVWENISTTTPDTTVFVQRITSQGVFWDNDFRVSSRNVTQLNPAIRAVEDKAIIVWEDKLSSVRDLYAQAVDYSGNRYQGWPAIGVAVSTAPGAQRRVALTDDDLGGVIAVWEDSRNLGNDVDIYAERISKTGVIGEFREIHVSSPTAGSNWEIGSEKTINWTATAELARIKVELVVNNSDPILIHEEDNVNPTNGSFTIDALMADIPPSENCKIVITAVDAPFIKGESETFEVSPRSGPELIPVEITEKNVGDSITVTTSAEDVSGVQEVTLNYKIGGGLSYSTIRMEPIGSDNYEAEIPANNVTSRGVSYFVSGTDSIGSDVIGTSDTFFVAVNFQAGSQVKLIRSGRGASGYRMISSPNLLTETLADSIFARSGFTTPYDTTAWRLYKYDNEDSTYVERDSLNADSFRFTPGTAYWLISANERVLGFGAGKSIAADKPFNIDLEPGWNQIANPFSFTVDWADIMTESGEPLVSVPYEFRGAQYIMPDTLTRYTGFFVYNHEDSIETLSIPPNQFNPNAPKFRKQSLASQDVWRLQILSGCGNARDDYNYIGLNALAKPKFDRLDLPEPPPFGEYVSVYFPQADWDRFSNNYTTDFRNTLGDGVTLTIHVKTNVANSEANLQFAGLEQIPSDVAIILFDEKLNVTQDLRERGTYNFVTGVKTTLKELKLLIGSEAFVDEALADASLVPDNFELSQNFPNPFNPTTSIRYGLPAEERVTVRIYDLLGREVKTLLSGDLQKAGYHVISWNGKDKDEIPVASGVYVYNVQAGNFSQSKKMVLVK